MWAAVDAATAHVTSSIFSDPTSTAYGLTRLTFEDFGNWYNSGGYKQVTVTFVTVTSVAAFTTAVCTALCTELITQDV
jgi:hypothetical protein